MRQDYQFLLAFDPQGYPLTYYPIADSDEATISGISTILKTELGIKTITPALYDELPPKVQRSGSKIWGLRLREVLPDAPDSEFRARCCLSMLALMLLKELQAKLTQRGLKLTIDDLYGRLPLRSKQPQISCFLPVYGSYDYHKELKSDCRYSAKSRFRDRTGRQ